MKLNNSPKYYELKVKQLELKDSMERIAMKITQLEHRLSELNMKKKTNKINLK